jgi:hypothetical protein
MPLIGLGPIVGAAGGAVLETTLQKTRADGNHPGN